MGDEVIPESVLDHLRRIGDPEMGAVLGQGDEEFPEAVRRGGLLRDEVELPQAAVALAQGADPDELDVDMLLHAQRLFATYGPEIAGALLLAALPQAYAASKGSRILAETTELHRNFRARILGTAQFLVVVMQGVENQAAKDLWIPGEDALDRSVMTPWKACLAVRCYHEAIRSQLGARPDGEEPLNQEDLLAPLLAFTVTVFEVLERYGITWTADDQQAYLYAWDLIGRRLGIGYPGVTSQLDKAFVARLEAEGWQGLRPPTVPETRKLADQLRRRQWPDPTNRGPMLSGRRGQESQEDPEGQEAKQRRWEGTRAGRILIRALIEELAVAMPRRREGRPLAVMRALAPAVVRDRLNLGGGGIVLASLDLLPRRHAVIDRFTAQPVANPIGGRLLRLMANEVTTHVIVNFIRTGGLRLPALEPWSGGIRERLRSTVSR